MKAVAVLIAVLGSVIVLAQAPAVVPVEQEPHHRLVLDNGYVKLLDVTLPPGYVSLFHTHALDNVSVRMTVGTMRTDLLTGDGAPQTSPAGRVAFYSASPPYTHRVVNAGDADVRILDVQIVAGTPIRDGVADGLAGHTVEVENARVRVARISLAAGQSLAAHTHPRGWLEADVAGPDAGRYVWHDAGFTAPAINSAGAPVDIVEVEPK